MSTPWNGESGQIFESGTLLVSDPNSLPVRHPKLDSLLGGESLNADVQEWSERWTQDWNMSMTRLVRETTFRCLQAALAQCWNGMEHGDVESVESQVSHLTGYQLSIDSYPFLRADQQGVAGMVGTEGFSIPLVLVQQELAHLAGRYWMLESNQLF